MPNEALGFLLIIVGVVLLALVIAVWMAKRDNNSAGEFEKSEDPFEDFEEKTVESLAENTDYLQNKSSRDIDEEIARKSAELERLQHEIEQAKQYKLEPQPAPQPKKKKKGGCFSTICALFFVFVIFAVSGGDDTKTTAPSVRETIEPKATATTKINKADVSPEIIKKAVEGSLAKLELFDYYNVSCDETAITMYVGFNDAAEDLARRKANGENESSEDWMTVKDSLMTVYNQVVGALADYGYTNQNCMLNLINTKNHDNILLMIHGGRIVYDAMQ